MNVQLESFFNDFDNTITRVLQFLQVPEAQIPAMARPQYRRTVSSCLIGIADGIGQCPPCERLGC